MNDVIVVQQSGGLGRRLAPTDGICGLITNGVAVMGGVAINKAYKLNALTDLVALQIDESYDTTNKVLVYRNVKDFFRLNPTGELWLYVTDNTDTYAQMVDNHTEALMTASNGAVKIIGYCYNDKLAGIPGSPVVLNTVIANAQTVCTQLTADHYPVSAVIEMVGYDHHTDVTDYRTKNARRVTAVAAQDFALIQDADFEKRCLIGLALGTIAMASVHENLGWVQKFNVLGGGLEKAAISDEEFSTIGLSALNTMNDNGLLFLRTHTGIAGLYWNDAPTCISATDDFAYLENNRVIDKATRLIREAFLPTLNSPVYVDPTSGKLAPNIVKSLETIGKKVINDGMLIQEEISGFEFTIDEEQDILATSQLEAVLSIVPVGTSRKIIVKIGFNNPF